MTTQIAVVMAEDNLLVREGVRGILAASAEISLLAVCANAAELRAAIAEHSPDVVVTDIHMPPDLADDGIRIARELRRDRPGVGVVVLSSRDDPQHALDLLEDGASGRAYLLKERVAQPGQLLNAIREVAGGGSVVDPRIVESLIHASTRSPTSAPSALDSLSARERDVLGAMARGGNNTSIAAELFITVRAVERHINSLFAKLGLTEEPDYHRRVRAVLLYLAEN
ncbi:MAG: DNA-binding response regulator [Pseudonocardiales bacterium]|nr:DNA-binding response regulator [Jatrophihabitantaceae bacterium]MCW2603981.1 DNA-binding response regulator [Pseudonocardiales bacterium]